MADNLEEIGNGGIPAASILGRKHKAVQDVSGFAELKLINLVIGKNNAGKSSLLDLVEHACLPKLGSMPARTIQRDAILAESPLLIRQRLSRLLPTDGEREQSHPIFQVAEYLRELPPIMEVCWSFTKHPTGGRTRVIEPDLCGPELRTLFGRIRNPAIEDSLEKQLRRTAEVPFEDRPLFRLLSDRDVKPERQARQNSIMSNGAGLVSTLEYFDNDGSGDPTMLDRIRHDLNAIYGPDAKFQSLSLREFGDSHWDIVLKEEHKPLVRLSASGSGLKTILLVLGFLHILPARTQNRTQDCIFCFEELENNLHPSVQRRLFQFLRDFALREKCMLFLTSHSNVAIDIFARCPEAQILHVTHNGTTASVQTLPQKDLGLLLDDLGFRASDILQSNFVLWVEGPSDRIYIKRGLELAAPDLEEGVHYSVLIYGGRLLSHFTYDTDWMAPEAADELINLARINRNSAILLDSDRKSGLTDPINPTKQRVIEGFKGGNALTWLTAGREIENYVPQDVFEAAVKAVHDETGDIRYGDFDSMVVLDESAAPKKYIDKVKVAKKVCESSQIAWRSDWNAKIQELAQAIRKANGMTTA